MNVIQVRNVHQALPEVMRFLSVNGIRRESRNGPVLKAPEPVAIVYARPTERVMFWEQRDANPFFHLLEALWMLCGRNDVAFPASIVGTMRNFSDDGVTFNGAYGHRWRSHFNCDQLETIAAALRENPDCRRQVLAMWDGHHDLGLQSKDLPCNTQAYFSINDGALDMMVTNRSNDAVWGALGANAVHFSVLLEYMAAKIGVKVGRYWQVTNNLHLYLDNHQELMTEMQDKAWPSTQFICPYACGVVKTTPLIPRGDVHRFEQDMQMLLSDGPALGMTDPFIRKVALPMLQAITAYKENTAPQKFIAAQEILGKMDQDGDWAAAAGAWINQRKRKWENR